MTTPSTREPDSVGAITRAAKQGRWLRQWMPGLHTLLHYDNRWLKNDVIAGLVLTAVLIPVGMGYAEASGLPAIHGLYATIVPLIAYALFGPSRVMVLGPDSTLAAVIAALILPLAGGSVERAVLLAGMLSLLTGLCQLIIGLIRLGVMADLFSKPVRIGFLNAIALTIIIGQLPKLLGFSVKADDLMDRARGLIDGILAGRVNVVAMAIGFGSLALILLLKRFRPAWPAVLIAVVLATLTSWALDLNSRAHIPVLGAMPHGLPAWQWPSVSWADVKALLPGGAMIALLSFADTSVLSRSLAVRGGYRVSQDQEMVSLGAANLANGFFQGFPISSSASRTPVAEAAGSRSQVTGLVGAATIALLLIIAPGLLKPLPNAVLGAVVIAACLSFADVPGMLALYRQRRVEFFLSVISFLGVALVGVIEGIVITIVLAMLVLVWNAWHPHFATLVRVDGRKGYHDAQRHPEGRSVPGLLIFRWDAQLFFANAEIFKNQVLQPIERAPASLPIQALIVAADAINDVDVTAADVLAELQDELARRNVELLFAGLKGPVKDRLIHYGFADMMSSDKLWPTVGNAVNHYRDKYAVAWKDWDEV